MPEQLIRFDWKPLPWQARVVKERRRFNAVDCGRRSGKTDLGKALATIEMVASGKPVAWFAPTYKILAPVWRELSSALAPITVAKSATDKRIEVSSGGSLEMWSLDSPDAGRSRKYARVVVDEAAMVPNLEEAWNAAIRPTLSDMIGDAWFLSTPKGRNFFYQLYLMGQDASEGEWASWTMPTSVNPLISPEEIEAAKRMLPERVFEQEYMAEFLEDSAVFRHIMEAVRAPGQGEPISRHTYVIGCDWGKLNDYSVFVVMDATNKEVAHIERMNMVDYPIQADRLQWLVQKWQPAQVVTETTGVGEPIADMLRERSIGLRRFRTTRRSKEELINWLIKAFDELEIRITNHPVLISELQMMEAQPTTSGFRYSAPSGYHDDCVIALALAWDGVRRSGVGSGRTIGKRRVIL